MGDLFVEILFEAGFELLPEVWSWPTARISLEAAEGEERCCYRSPIDFDDGFAGLGLEPGFGAYANEEHETVIARQNPDDMALFN
ncbi:hypothetical protein [Halegenticoccus tardaugens]|uniref:hypothetical protein n=1 Tax=Halegenticoccus tardaugens TaxID=2071624 RepID=UPI002264F93E|nr:hypothetical protein [Halegenticoccus tardaugens]